MLLLDPNHSASNLFTACIDYTLILIALQHLLYTNITKICVFWTKKIYSLLYPLNNIIYSNRRFKMDFSTIVVIVLVLAIAYTLAKAYSKKQPAVAPSVSVAEVAAKAEVVETPAPAKKAPAKKPAAKKPTVKKATTRKTKTSK